MKNRDEARSRSGLGPVVRRPASIWSLVACLGILLAPAGQACAQAVPNEDYGPYNATFLPDGPGLTKSLAAPSPLDSRTAALLDRLGLNKQPDARDALLSGGAGWTLAFWFR